MKTFPARATEKLPDPWLFDSETLLRELDRCRQKVLEIPTNGDCNATHFGIQIAVNAIYTLSENLRYLLHLHREQQRAIRKQHEHELQRTLSKATAKIIHLPKAHTPAPSNRKKPNNIAHTHSTRERFAKRRRASSQVA